MNCLSEKGVNAQLVLLIRQVSRFSVQRRDRLSPQSDIEVGPWTLDRNLPIQPPLLIWLIISTTSVCNACALASAWLPPPPPNLSSSSSSPSVLNADYPSSKDQPAVTRRREGGTGGGRGKAGESRGRGGRGGADRTIYLWSYLALSRRYPGADRSRLHLLLSQGFALAVPHRCHASHAPQLMV